MTLLFPRTREIIFNSCISIILSPHAVRLSPSPRQSLRQGPQYPLLDAAKDSVAAILKATGKPVDDAQVDAVIAALNGRAVNDVLQSPPRSLALASARWAASVPPREELPPLPPRTTRRITSPRRRRRRPLLRRRKKRETSTSTCLADLNPIGTKASCYEG